MAVEVYNGKGAAAWRRYLYLQIELMKYLPAEAYERYELGDRANRPISSRHATRADERAIAATRCNGEQSLCSLRFRRRLL